MSGSEHPSVDRRDMILDRLVELLQDFTIQLTGTTLSGPLATQFVHNRGELPSDKAPGVILLDADEARDPRFTPRQPGRAVTPVRSQVMRMTPEIYLVLDVRKPLNENVGKDLSKARAALLSLVMLDPILSQIVGSNGEIIYDGCLTDLARNRVMKGQMGVSFTFVYPLSPYDL
jgi:hypothetical protein